MKKITVSAFISFLALASLFGQFNSGSLFIAGTTGLHLESYGGKEADSDFKESYLNFIFQPRAGYFIKDRIAVGGAIMSDISKSSQDDGNYEYSSTESTFILGPFGRYYFEYGSLMPFVDAFIGFGKCNSKYKTGDTTTETPYSVFRFAGGGGADYMINESIAIEAILQYMRERDKSSGDSDFEGTYNYNGVIFNLGIVIYIGSI